MLSKVFFFFAGGVFSASAFGRMGRENGRIIALADRANDVAKLLKCAPIPGKSRIRSFETCLLCKYLHFNYHMIGIQKVTAKQNKTNEQKTLFLDSLKLLRVQLKF